MQAHDVWLLTPVTELYSIMSEKKLEDRQQSGKIFSSHDIVNSINVFQKVKHSNRKMEKEQ